jgi:hypothetical protein
MLALGIKDLWIYFHEIWWGGDVIQGGLTILLNPTASTILKWLRFEFVR